MLDGGDKANYKAKMGKFKTEYQTLRSGYIKKEQSVGNEASRSQMYGDGKGDGKLREKLLGNQQELYD